MWMMNEEDNGRKPVPKLTSTQTNLVVGFILLLVILIVGSGFNWFRTASTDSEQAVTTLTNNAVIAAATPQATPVPTPALVVHKLGEKVDAGKFGLSVASAAITSQLKSDYTDVKTEDQFVVIKVTITNNDVKARDVSTNMFILADGTGKTYEAYDRSVGVSGDEFLFYETINPGLSRTRSVAFETPKGIAGLKIIADSGVAFAGGEKVTIDLGQ